MVELTGVVVYLPSQSRSTNGHTDTDNLDWPGLSNLPVPIFCNLKCTCANRGGAWGGGGEVMIDIKTNR